MAAQVKGVWLTRICLSRPNGMAASRQGPGASLLLYDEEEDAIR
jgi:hypothetical protein